MDSEHDQGENYLKTQQIEKFPTISKGSVFFQKQIRNEFSIYRPILFYFLQSFRSLRLFLLSCQEISPQMEKETNFGPKKEKKRKSNPKKS